MTQELYERLQDEQALPFWCSGVPFDKLRSTFHPDLIDFKRTFINAHITERSGELTLSNEGCLSIPDIREDILRNPKIIIEYVNENFEKITETFEGITAVIIQHEYDHLDGILFTDKVSPLRKKFLKRKLSTIAKGRFNKKYKVKLGEKYR